MVKKLQYTIIDVRDDVTPSLLRIFKEQLFFFNV